MTTDRYSFGWALKNLQYGSRVRRAEWRDNDVWLAYSPGADALPAAGFWAGPNRDYAAATGGTARVQPCITQKRKDGSIMMGWTPTTAELFALDWEVVSDDHA